VETERAESERETFAGGWPLMTVSQCLLSARKRWIWRRAATAVRSSQRDAPCRDSVVLTVEVAVVVVLVVVFGLS
jgi:hypothetical protein